MALAVLFLSATVTVFGTGEAQLSNTNNAVTLGHGVGAGDVTGTYVPD